MTPPRTRFAAALAGFCLATGVTSATAAKLWIFGDSTVKDYTNSQDACSTVLAIAGWGQYILDSLGKSNLSKVSSVIVADSLVVDNRANGGRAARSFITGADTAVLRDAYSKMKAGDYMLIQFGHNDEADCATYPDRCTPVADYKKYLGLYVDSVRSKGATPILVTPMVRNAWPEYDTHDNSDSSKTNQQIGNFPLAMQQVAKEKGVPCVDLTQRSIDDFNALGNDATKYTMFRQVRSGTTLPTGCASISDGTHFQPGGAKEMARQIYLGLRSVRKVAVTISDTSLGTVVGTSNGVKDKANKTWLVLTNDFRNGAGWYENDHNPTVKIQAKPKTGYVFAGWSGDTTGTTNPLTLPMTRNYKITATFSKTSGVVDRSAPGGGVRYDAATRMLQVRLASPGPARVEIRTVDGRGPSVVLESSICATGSLDLPLNPAHPGVYLVRLEQEGRSSQQSFVVP
jgi:uncharacterized repeat protein (TIGR02543 family)